MKRDKTTLSPSLERLILRRDRFTCTECGKQVPKVFLQIDRVLSTESADEIGNVSEEEQYTCLCESCSRKFHKRLQTSPISTTADRRAQLDMLIAWRREERTLDDAAFDIVVDYLRPKIKPAYLYKEQKEKLRSLLKDNDIIQMLDAIDTSVSRYAKYEDDDCTQESAKEVVAKLGGILYNMNLGPIESELGHIRSICKRNFGADFDNQFVKSLLHEYMIELKRQGITQECDILSELADKPRRYACSCGTFEQWCRSMRNLLPEQEEDEFIIESKAFKPVPSAANFYDNEDDELYPGSKDPIHGADNMSIYLANIRYRTVKYLYIHTGLFTLERWNKAEAYFQKGLANFLESEMDFLCFNGLQKRNTHIEDLAREFLDGGTWASLMRDNFEWRYGGNPDMPAEIKGFIIGDMLQLFINDILDQFYFWNPKDYDEAMSSLDYYLNHISEILDTSDITDGDFDF